MDKYHTGWQRFLAFMIDGFILQTAGAAIYGIICLNIALAVNIVAATAYSILNVSYFIYMHGRFGQTFGKFLTRVRLVDISGCQITYNQALLRDIVPCLLLPFSLWTNLFTIVNLKYPTMGFYQFAYQLAFIWVLLELITMLFNEQRRAIHDFIAGTVVIRVG
jgi:uncharacterized RDD family membrane protein YckC